MAALWIRRAVRPFVNMVKSQASRSTSHARNFANETLEIDQSAQKGQVVSNVTNIGGNTIHYLKTGHGNRLILLLPGMLGCAELDFMHQINGLNKDLFTVVAWDPPGYGKSRPPERTWPKDWIARDAEIANSLMNVVQKEDATISRRKVSLAGWSDGGTTACVLAARYPDRVDRLISWGAATFVTDADVAANESIRDIKKWSQRMRDSYLTVYEEDYFARLCSDWCDAYNAYYDNDGGICQKDLPNIECPTLILHGKKDALVGQEHPDYLHKNIKDSRLLILPDGKHNLHQKFHHKFNSLVEQFIINPDNVYSNI